MGENTPCLTPEGIGDTDDMRGRKETQGSATEVTGWVVFPGYDLILKNGTFPIKQPRGLLTQG